MTSFLFVMVVVSTDCSRISTFWLSSSGIAISQNELPGSGFEPASSERVFHLVSAAR